MIAVVPRNLKFPRDFDGPTVNSSPNASVKPLSMIPYANKDCLRAYLTTFLNDAFFCFVAKCCDKF